MLKHAYLIMAHNNLAILEKLVLLLDDEANDIYIHLDKKVKNFDFKYYTQLVKKSKLYFTKRLNVKWGSYKQIECEYTLFKAAYPKHYDYYHLISGVDMPIASQKEIHKFFALNKGKEFVIFDNHQDIVQADLERISLYHFFVSWARSKSNFLRKRFDMFHFHFLNLQRKLKINRLKKVSWHIRKGANWVSITHEFLEYVLQQEKKIKKIFKYSYCADELFIQTILYNSPFYEKVMSLKNDDYEGLKRYIDWHRGQPYTFKTSDFEEIIKSKCFFVRKLTEDDKLYIDIYDYLKGVKL